MVAGVAAVSLMTAPDASATARGWQVYAVVLPDLGAGAFPDAVNDAGDIAGHVDVPGRTLPSNAAVWRDGRLIVLDIPGSSSSVAQEINDSGAVAGTWYDKAGYTHGFVWEDGVTTDLGDLGAPFRLLQVTGLNERGDVVGYGSADGADIHAFVWSRGLMTDIGATLEGTSEALDVDNQGRVTVGLSHYPDVDRAFLWSHGVLTELRPSGVKGPTPWFVNSRGDVAGRADPAVHTGNTPDLGFVWNDGSTVVLPGRVERMSRTGSFVYALSGTSGNHDVLRQRNGRTVPIPSLGSGWDLVRGVDGRTEVAGNSARSGCVLDATTVMRGYFWAAGHVIELGGPQGEPSVVSAMSDTGRVIGTIHRDGQVRAVSWTVDRRGTPPPAPDGSSPAQNCLG